jgi:hypothetical protein
VVVRAPEKGWIDRRERFGARNANDLFDGCNFARQSTQELFFLNEDLSF